MIVRRSVGKVGDWLDAGARLCVGGRSRNAASRESTAQTERSSCWAETDQLLGEDVLPGFSCTLASILGM